MAAALFIVVWSGCSTEPTVTLVPGIYDYDMTMDGRGSYSGTLHIDTSEEFEATGHWEVSGFIGSFEGPTGMNGSEYLISAKLAIAPRYLIIHRIDPTSLACSGAGSIIDLNGQIQSRSVTCTLVRR